MSKRPCIAAFVGPVFVVALCIPLGPIGAESEPAPTWHLYSGLDATRSSLFGHKGFVWSPWDNLHTPGWRLRGQASAGGYRYETGGLKVSGRSAAVEIMPGRAWWIDGLGVKVYAGPTIEHHETDPYDPEKPRQGTCLGVKALAEGWVRLSDAVIIDTSASFATAERRYSLRLAGGIELRQGLVLEPEIAVFGEAGYHQLRIGLFAAVYRSDGFKALVGGGMAFDRDGSGPYMGLRLKSWHRFDTR